MILSGKELEIFPFFFRQKYKTEMLFLTEISKSIVKKGTPGVYNYCKLQFVKILLLLERRLTVKIQKEIQHNQKDIVS